MDAVELCRMKSEKVSIIFKKQILGAFGNFKCFNSDDIW